MRSEDGTADANPLSGNHENQHTFRHQPSETVFEEHNFTAPRAILMHFVVVRRIEIEQRIRFNRRVRIKGAALDNLMEILPRFFRPKCIELNAIQPGASIAGNQIERAARSSAWIESGARIRELKKLADALCLVFDQREIAELLAGRIASHSVCSPWLSGGGGSCCDWIHKTCRGKLMDRKVVECCYGQE